jgi:hypothetical protein
MQPPPAPPPPPSSHSPQRDEEHIRLLVVFHYVMGGFALAGVLFLVLHFYFMNAFFGNEEMWKDAQGSVPPAEFFAMFKWFYAIMAAVFVAACVMNVLSAVFMQRRQNRMYSMVVGGLNCMNMPFGTALGVFTIIILMRPSVQAAYDQVKSP